MTQSACLTALCMLSSAGGPLTSLSLSLSLIVCVVCGSTIGDKAVLIYDSNKYPFYPGELYHQFHNDFMGPAYGQQYNALKFSQYQAKKLDTTGCPDIDPKTLLTKI